MTISSTARVAGPFVGAGSTATFPFTFKVFDATDLYVLVLTVATGAIAALVLDSDYSAALNADQDSSPGGSITLTAGNLATGLTLTITTDIAALQGLDLTNGGGFYPDVINGALDLLTVLVQQLLVQVNLAVQVPITDVGMGMTLPPAAERAGKALYFDSTGAPIVLAMAPSGTSLFSGVLDGTKDSANKVFTLTLNGTPLGKTPLQATVWLNFPLIEGVGYTLGPGVDQVTFTNAPKTTDSLFAQGVYQA